MLESRRLYPKAKIIDTIFFGRDSAHGAPVQWLSSLRGLGLLIEVLDLSNPQKGLSTSAKPV